MVKPMLEYLRQDIKAHLRDLQEGSSTTVTQEDSKNVDLPLLINQMNKRLSKVERIVLPQKSLFNERKV